MILEAFFQEQRNEVISWLDRNTIGSRSFVLSSVRTATHIEAGSDLFPKALDIFQDLTQFLPAMMITLESWTQKLFDRLRPVLGSYAQEAMSAFWQRILSRREVQGQEPPQLPPGLPTQVAEVPGRPILDVGFPVTNPKLSEAVDQLTLRFCEETNATTSQALADALEATREALRDGVVEGLAMEDLTRRVNAVFDDAETWRAKRIAVTESSRAVHMAEYMSAQESGVVQGIKWLASADACDKCLELADKVVPLGTPFVIHESGMPEYAAVYHPPLHPNCQCTTVEVLTDDPMEGVGLAELTGV